MNNQFPFFMNWMIFFFLGIAGIFFGSMFLLVGALSERSLFFNICVPITIIPGILGIMIGLILRQRQKRFEHIAEMVRAYRRIRISELAQKMGKTEFEAERMLVQCIDRKLIEGYFDRTTGEFFTKEEMGQRRAVQNCPRCGAPHDQIHLVGENFQCKFCGMVFPVRQQHGFFQPPGDQYSY